MYKHILIIIISVSVKCEVYIKIITYTLTMTLRLYLLIIENVEKRTKESNFFCIILNCTYIYMDTFLIDR